MTIGFQYGDEAMSYEELYFKKIGSKVIGSITQPNTDKVLPSDVELNTSQTKIIDSFLSLTEKFKKSPCLEKNVSSYVQYYTVIKDKDTHRIYRFCDWQNLKFFSIKQSIFGSYLKALDIKKASKRAEYFKILKGKWNESTALDKLSLTAVCKLTKADPSTTINEYVEFVSPTKLVLHRKNTTVAYNYHLEFSGKNTYIQLDPIQNGQEFAYGHSFLVVELLSETLKLSRGFP
ncbi:MAG: hypothetical protein EOP48_17925 [Sphingobacteriales bacterium]|nr:MAG: hypothetical protein EOP48_17925 [Sphingobacteriales bacterium]